MTLERPPQAVCPHCGFEADIEELCRVCGKPADGDIPGSKVSVVHTLGNFFSKMKEKGCHGVEKNELTDLDASDDPGLAHLPGNSYHYIWSDDDD